MIYNLGHLYPETTESTNMFFGVKSLSCTNTIYPTLVPMVIQFVKSSRKGDLWFKSDNSKLVLETLFCKTRGKRICITRNSNNNEKLLLAIPLDYTRNVSFQTCMI